MRRTIPLIVALATLLAASPAHASGADAVRDCTDDEVLQGRYTQAELRVALANLGADADQYTNCRRILKQAQLAGASGGGTDPGAGGTTPGGAPTDANDPNAGGSANVPGAFGGFTGLPADELATATREEQQALAEVRAVEPPGLNRSASIGGSDLPAPLWVVLAVGALGLIALIATDLRRRVIARRAG